MRTVIKAAFIALTIALAAPVAARDFEAVFEVHPLDEERIALEDSNVRAGPSLSHEPITILIEGSRVDVTGQALNGEWLRIALSDGRDGYVFGNLLGPVGAISAEGADNRPLPIATAVAPKAAANIEAGYEAYKRGDFAAALREFRPLAQQGKASAQAMLGHMYEQGQGVSQDYAKAVKWYRMAGEQGQAGAQFNLGGMYADGRGVAQDNGEAARWFRNAAEQDHAKAQNNLGALYARGRGVAQDNAEAVMWYCKAAEQGNDAAQFNLGNMYGKGLGVPRDMVQAHMWWNLAASQGDKETTKNRAYAADEMTPAQIAEAEKLAREWRPK